MAARRVWSNSPVPAGGATSSTVAGPIASIEIKSATGLISNRPTDDGLRELKPVGGRVVRRDDGRCEVRGRLRSNPACPSGCSASSHVAHATA
jgi:hypothetical protein